jgi:multicomponent Na+:H+ antiporter subunit F
MTLVYLLLTCLLLVTLTVGMWRVLRGPTAADRMLAAQLFGTTAVAILLIFAQMTNYSSLRDVALLLALLAAVTVVAFIRKAWQSAIDDNDESSW